MKHHIVTPKTIGKYTLCASCLRGIVQDGPNWKHIVRTAWKAA